MKIDASNRFVSSGVGPGAQKRPAKTAKTNTPQDNRVLQQQMEQQKQRHLSFLIRAKAGITFYQEKITEAHQLVEQYKDFEQEEFQEVVSQAREAIPEFEAMMEELQKSLNNGIEENVFVMSTLEALLNEDGKFPVHTLEAYLKRRDEAEDAEETAEKPRYKTYSIEDLDRMISALKTELGGIHFSAKA